MATNNLKIVKGRGPVLKYRTEERTGSGFGVTIKPGEPVNFDPHKEIYAVVAGDSYGKLIQDFMYIPSDRYIGVCVAESTETSTANGEVLVALNIPQTVVRAKEQTAAGVDTQAEIDGICGYSVLMYRTEGKTTVGTFYIRAKDPSGTVVQENPNLYGCLIIDGDPGSSSLDVVISQLLSPSSSIYSYDGT